MMKGVIFDIKRFSVNDGPGIRTTVFFKGCPLNCLWCHNPEGRSYKIQEVMGSHMIGYKSFACTETIGREITVNEVIDEIEKDRVFYEESNGGVTLSGGEPLFHFEFLFELLKTLKNKNIKIAVDTTGFTETEYLKSILEYVDLFLYDIKAMDDNIHFKYTGVSNKIIFDNLAFILNNGGNVIIRYPVIPGVNDSENDISLLRKFILKQNGKIKEIDFLPFHNIANNKYKKLNMDNTFKDTPSLNKADLVGLKSQFEEIGLKVKIGG